MVLGTMTIPVRFTGVLARELGISSGQLIHYTLPADARYRDLIGMIRDQYAGSFPDNTWDEEANSFHPHVQALQDGERLAGPDSPLRADTEVIFLVGIAGGAATGESPGAAPDSKDEADQEDNENEEEPMASMTASRAALLEVAPHLAQITDDVVFGDIWEREQLSKRDRSLITVATLTALYRTDQLRNHIRRALENGVTREEIGEVITHMAFYAGWPTAVNAAKLAKEVFDEEPDQG